MLTQIKIKTKRFYFTKGKNYSLTVPRGGEDVGKYAFPYMTGGSICVPWKEIGQDLGEGEIVPT